MKNIVLVGLMGAGKSTVGKIIAEKLLYRFVDTDELIVKKAGISINEIFAQLGESNFRLLESQVIKEVSSSFDQIVSTGGGAVINPENVCALKSGGLLVYLRSSAENLFERIKGDSGRPLLQIENPLKKLQSLLDERSKYYEQADIIVDVCGRTPQEIADEIIKKYEKACKC